jgi:formylglycine-generating enzyme required for sulfatase activity
LGQWARLALTCRLVAAAQEEREKALTRERAALRRGRFALTAATGLLACVVFGATAVYYKDLLWEQYHWRAVMRPSVLTASREKEIAAKPGADFAECSNGCPRMIVVPTDKFTMGSPDNQGWPKDEGRQREVKIAMPFAVGRTAVTFAEWDFCVVAGACPKVYDPHGSIAC